MLTSTPPLKPTFKTDFKQLIPLLDILKLELSLYWVNVDYLLKARKLSIYRMVLYYKSIGIKVNKVYLYELKRGKKRTPNILILFLIANYLKEPLFKLFTYNYQLGIEQDVNINDLKEF